MIQRFDKYYLSSFMQKYIKINHFEHIKWNLEIKSLRGCYVWVRVGEENDEYRGEVDRQEKER